MNKIMRNIYSMVTFLAVALLVACTGMDHYYEDFIKDGPAVYPGRVADVQVFAGKNRIKFSMKTFPDPTVENVWVKWTYRGVADSLSAEVTKGREYNTAEILLENLEEDFYTPNYGRFRRTFICTLRNPCQRIWGKLCKCYPEHICAGG